MIPDTQRSILAACGRFILKRLEPITKRLDDIETKELTVDLSAVVKELIGTPELQTIVDLHVAEAVAKHFAENPIEKGDPGEPGKDGIDGASVTAADVYGIVELEVMKGLRDLERHAGEVIQRAADAIPKPKDGKDGADFADVTFDYDGERTLVIRGKGGEIVKRLPIPMDRGYWREGMAAEKGDILTHDGNAWIALKETATKPGHEHKDDWRLFARKGRDGNKGDPGKAYVPPAPVALGADNA